MRQSICARVRGAAKPSLYVGEAGAGTVEASAAAMTATDEPTGPALDTVAACPTPVAVADANRAGAEETTATFELSSRAKPRGASVRQVPVRDDSNGMFVV